ncbi:MAG TPA: cupredoxin domain-containing protein [Actinomycetes bacterium]|jgi:plastocyanin|nr:cupredoxin domain-containing protein [Actinomycetes bacterium]
MRRRGGLVAGALVVMLAVAAAGCGGDDGGGSAGATTAAPETTGAPETSAAGGAGENELKLTAQGIAWDITSLELTSGTSYTLEVTNKDGIEHNFTFAGGNANQDIERGEDATISFTAPAAGSYEFHCKYHPGAMKGTVTVT